MRQLKPFLFMHRRSIARSCGLPNVPPWRPIKLFRTVSLALAWAAATVLLILKVAAPAKLIVFSLLYQYWASLLIGMIGLGTMIARHWLRFGVLEEIQFLLALPLTKVSIARWRILRLMGELGALFLLMLPAIIPWGMKIKWDLYGLQMLLLLIITLTGILTGILIDSLILSLFRRRPMVAHLLSYGTVLLMLVASSIIGPVNNINLPMKSVAVVVLCAAFLVLGILLLNATARAVPISFVSVESTNPKIQSTGSQKSWGGFALAIACKDLLHYKRETNQLMQMVLFAAVLLLLFKQVDTMGAMVTRVMLLGIPYSFAGIITMHLTGSDGIALTYIKICRGSLKQYYGIRYILSYVFVLVPSLLAYTMLAAFFFRDGLSLPYYIALFFICFVSVALSLGISVMFKKNPNPLLPTRGTSALGELLYWILGIGLILQIAMWMPNTTIIAGLPIGFNILAAITIVSAVIFLTIGFYMIDAISSHS